MFRDVLSLEFPTRLGIFACCNILLVVWARFFMASVKPGLQRLIFLLPHFTINYFVSCLFNRENPEEQTLSVFVLGTYLGIGSLKAIAFCFNRGQVARVLDSGNLAAFAVALLLPVNLEFDEKPLDRSKKDGDVKKTVYEDVEYSLVSFKGIALLKQIAICIARFCGKAIMCYGFARLSKLTNDFEFRQSVALSWFLYFFLTTMQDANKLIGLIAFNLKLSPNFRSPFLATSVSSFWAERWNLIVSCLLRDTFYHPVLEGSLVALPSRLKRVNPSTPRRVLGMIVVFTASGLIHGYLMMVLMNTSEFPVLYSGFFAINAFVVIFEKCLKGLFVRKGMSPNSLSFFQSFVLIIYTQAVLLPLGHWFFWPDLVRLQFIQPTVDAIIHLGSALV